MNNRGYEEVPRQPLSGLSAFVRIVLGIALSMAGSYVILAVLVKIKEIFENPELLKIFLTLMPEEPKLRTLVYQGQDIILPLASFQYISYGVCILLLMVAGMLGGSLLKRGIWLLVP